MQNLNYLKIIGLAALLVLVSGCSISFGNDGNDPNDGGVYVSGDKGDVWNQKVGVLTASGKTQRIAALAVEDLAMDPNDHEALYLGSRGNGLFYTYDIREGWHKVDGGVPKTTVDAVTVDPKSKCIIYASAKNAIYKSTDCSRTWSAIYFDNKKDTTINSIAIDHYDTSNIYIGTSRGDVLKSLDGGVSWQRTFGDKSNDSAIDEINISPHDSRIILAATREDGILKTTDAGGEWVYLEEQMEEFNNSKRVRDINQCESEKGLVFAATSYGLLRSPDYGETWKRLELITPEKEAVINAVTINPDNCSHIYYVTNNTFYRSLDGGENWSTIDLPGSRPGKELLIDFKNPSILYLGMGPEKKKSRY